MNLRWNSTADDHLTGSGLISDGLWNHQVAAPSFRPPEPQEDGQQSLGSGLISDTSPSASKWRPNELEGTGHHLQELLTSAPAELASRHRKPPDCQHFAESAFAANIDLPDAHPNEPGIVGMANILRREAA